MENKDIEKKLESYRNYIYAICKSIIDDDEDDVDEATQRTMIYIWENMDKYVEARGPFKSWVAMIANSQSINVLRERADNKLDIDDVPEEELVAPDDPEQEYSNMEKEEKIKLKMRTFLSERQARALEMWVFSEASYEDIAAHFGISIQAARQLVYVAREKMKVHRDYFVEEN